MWKKTIGAGLLAISLTLIANPSTAEVVPPQPDGYQPPPFPAGMTKAEAVRGDSLSDTVGNLERETKGLPGLAGFAVDEDLGVVTVRWKTPVPMQVMAGARVAEAGVNVRVIPAAWSLADADIATNRVIAAVAKGAIPRPTSMTLGNDAATLRVGFPRDAGGEPQVTVTAEQLGAIAGMPVTLFSEEKVQLTTRINDYSPWLGGGLMRRKINGIYPTACSTGFSMHVDGSSRLLSAAHCDVPGNAAWADGTGMDQLTYGGSDVDVLRNTLDTMLIDPVGETAGYVFGGGWNAPPTDPRYILKVAGFATSPAGETVCTSGANSGEHCGVKVFGNPAKFDCSDEYTEYWCQGQFIYSADGMSPIMVGGDSGGPVYHQRSDGRVSARGIIDAGHRGYYVTCPSVALDPDGACFRAGYMVTIGLVRAYWDSLFGTVVIDTVP